MFTRLSTVFVVLLGLMALVSAGVPEESPEPDPGKPVVVGHEESPEPDPCTTKAAADLYSY
ncbi:uncharacterized protein BJ212DRAFT_1490515 [Suillus subaureus]|uniref:Uncharacterized protein n=1 Tax=Suillus subaureus TaxID=48587 RepID=A0A9P7DHG2_9AGAM|nr:uncharacterized protein BJ212DRAFT_1490515 [Suillus subaureus]KAG1793039.1 hypothetical protein BJ212DRAFT_1490515 [Suillus subaureus]